MNIIIITYMYYLYCYISNSQSFGYFDIFFVTACGLLCLSGGCYHSADVHCNIRLTGQVQQRIGTQGATREGTINKNRLLEEKTIKLICGFSLSLPTHPLTTALINGDDDDHDLNRNPSRREFQLQVRHVAIQLCGSTHALFHLVAAAERKQLHCVFFYTRPFRVALCVLL